MSTITRILRRWFTGAGIGGLTAAEEASAKRSTGTRTTIRTVTVVVVVVGAVSVALAGSTVPVDGEPDPARTAPALDDEINSEFEVTIEETSSPVEAGEELNVTVTIENVGSATDRQLIALYDCGLSGNVVDRHNETLDPGESAELTLGWTTDQDDGDVTNITVASDTHKDTVNVTVITDNGTATASTADDGQTGERSDTGTATADQSASDDGDATPAADGDATTGNEGGDTDAAADGQAESQFVGGLGSYPIVIGGSLLALSIIAIGAIRLW